MKLYRFMSFDEFQKFNAGIELVNNNHFKKCRTESNGFCFLPEKVNGYNVNQFIEFLNGIVSTDILVEFQTLKKNVTKSRGLYNDPVNGNELMEVTEYCTKKYSRDEFICTRYAMLNKSNKITWYSGAIHV